MATEQTTVHIPVLLHEAVDALNLQPGDRAIDGTVGGGGHTAVMLDHTASSGRILGLDADAAAIERVTERFAEAVAEERLRLTQTANWAMQKVALAEGFAEVQGILLDLGLSSFQLETAARGFSLMMDGPLDMRYDASQTLHAATIVNEWSETELADLIYEYGEEHRSRRIARFIVQNRPLHTTDELAEVVAKAVGGRRGKRIHPATQTFQALRIAVNRELEQLSDVLPQALQLLRPGGRLAVISFHSLEDRIVKRWMQAEARDFVYDRHHPYGGTERQPTVRLITTKPITPSAEEIEHNPRSRSAKLRVAEKLSDPSSDN